MSEERPDVAESGDRSGDSGLRVFISYRREDAADAAGRIYDRLAPEFGDKLFMDVDSLPKGVDFVEALDTAVAKCDVLIAVIGKHWLDAREPGRRRRRRLDDPNDFVRIEIESGLRRPGIRVIPLLVQDAPMPSVRELPDSLKPLARRNFIRISHTNWAEDMRSLVKDLTNDAPRLIAERQAREVGERQPLERTPIPTASEPQSTRHRRWPAVATIGAVIAAIVFGIVLVRPGSEPTVSPTGSPSSIASPSVDAVARLVVNDFVEKGINKNDCSLMWRIAGKNVTQQSRSAWCAGLTRDLYFRVSIDRVVVEGQRATVYLTQQRCQQEPDGLHLNSYVGWWLVDSTTKEIVDHHFTLERTNSNCLT